MENSRAVVNGSIMPLVIGANELDRFIDRLADAALTGGLVNLAEVAREHQMVVDRVECRLLGVGGKEVLEGRVLQCHTAKQK